MGKTLIIAEKPSVMTDLSKALAQVFGKFEKSGKARDAFFENDQAVITSAVGHLVELRMPVGPNGKKLPWKFDVLPAIPDRFELDPTRRAGTYSKGNRQKVGLIAALASDVELLVLDEPTSGLDPLMESVFQECVRTAAADGTTVLLSSHILAEVEKLCRRVSIIRAGRIVETGTLAELRHVKHTSVTARTRQAVDLSDLTGVTSMRIDGDRIEFEVDDDHLDDAMARIGAAGVLSLQSAPPTLEEIFMRHYSDDDPVAAETTGPAA